MSDAPSLQRFSEPAGETTLPLAAGGALAVANTVGAIALRGADRNDLRISWKKRGEPGTPEWNGLELEIARSGDRISVRPLHPERSFGRAAWIDLEIELPAASESLAVELENGAGEVEIAGVSCRSLRILVASGEARLADVSGETRIQSASGDVAVNGLAGDLSVRAASGDVAVLGHRRGALVAETASGDVRWRPAGPAEARIRTVSGDIVAEVALETGWRVGFRSVSGIATLPPRFAQTGRAAWSARGARSSSGAIEARTVSGGLRVVEIGEATDDGEAASPCREPPRDRDAILRAVERGELGVDDAMRLLDDLSDGAHPA